MLVLHVGYAKTGTTLLQRRIFPRLRNANYMGRTYNADGTAGENLTDLVAAVNGAPDINPNNVRGRLIANMRDGVNIISQETLLLPYQTENGAERLAHVTRGIDTRILITIRKQESMIWSRYVHDRTRTRHIIPKYDLGDALAAEGECAWPFCHTLASQFDCKCKAAKAKLIPLNFLDYERIYNLYADYFGAENVYVLPLEFSVDKSRYFDQLENALGVRISQEIRTTVNTSERVNAGKQWPELMADKAKLPWLGTHKLFASSNITLSDRLGLDLDEYGYFRPHYTKVPAGTAYPASQVAHAS